MALTLISALGSSSYAKTTVAQQTSVDTGIGALITTNNGYITGFNLLGNTVIGTGAFTVEFYIYIDTATIPTNSLTPILYVGSTNQWFIGLNGGTFNMKVAGTGGWGYLKPLAKAWTHMAFVRYSTGAHRTFLNGILDDYTLSYFANSNMSAFDANVMTGSNAYCNNIYVSNIRVTNKAVYSTASTAANTGVVVFEPPLAPLPLTQSASTNISAISSGECLLLLQMASDSLKYYNSATGQTLTPTNTLTFSRVILSDSLLHYLKGNQGDIVGSTTVNSGSAGSTLSITNLSISSTIYKIGNGSFDIRSNGFISLQNKLTFPGTYSLSMWVKIPATRSGNTAMFFVTTSGTGVNAYGTGFCFYKDTSNKLYVDVAGQNRFISAAMASLVNDTWTHLVLTGIGSTNTANYKVYVNGASIANTVSTTTISYTFANSGESRIGNSSWNNTEFIGGYMDDIRIYSRTLSYNGTAIGSTIGANITKGIDITQIYNLQG